MGIFYAYNTISSGQLISGNEIYDHGDTGIYGPTINSVISTNDIHGNRYGIYSQFQNAAGIPNLQIVGNRVHDNTDYGIWANSNQSNAILVDNNEVYGHSGTGDVAIYAYGGTEVTRNRVYGNYLGIATHSHDIVPLTTIRNNRVFGNSFVAIQADGRAQVEANYVYSNSIGINTTAAFFGTIGRNLIYANTNRGISIQNSSNGATAQYLNNTIYQQVGDGIRLDGSARNNVVYNNIVWVLSGYAMYVDNNSQVGFQSDYNLLTAGTDPNSNVGFWAGAARKTLADFQSASSRDLNSVSSLPGFVDIDGADNVLGYVTTASGNIDGGLDDNFYRVRSSPAIDRGSTWTATRTDIENFGRYDDPGTVDAGGPRYIQSSQAPTVFGPANLGVAQGWRADDATWSLSLPFSFNFADTNWTSVNVSSNGLLQFGSSTGADSPDNSNAQLSVARASQLCGMISPRLGPTTIFLWIVPLPMRSRSAGTLRQNQMVVMSSLQ